MYYGAHFNLLILEYSINMLHKHYVLSHFISLAFPHQYKDDLLVNPRSMTEEYKDDAPSNG